MYCILCINGGSCTVYSVLMGKSCTIYSVLMFMYCILCINGGSCTVYSVLMGRSCTIYSVLMFMYCILMISFLCFYLLKGKKSTSSQSEDIRLSRKGKIKSCCKCIHVEQSLKICCTCIIRPLKQIYSFSGLQCSKIIIILDFFDFGLCQGSNVCLADLTKGR